MVRALLSSVLTVSLLGGAATPALAALASFTAGSEVALAQSNLPAVAVATTAGGGQLLVEASAMRRLPASARPALVQPGSPAGSPLAVATCTRHRSYYPRRRDTVRRRRGSDGRDVPH
jgi:hypothetical protein